MLVDKTFRELLDAFSSSSPTPGGGSAAAAASAMGASLLMMVAGLPKTKSNSDDERKLLAAARAALENLQRALTTAVDDDTRAYDEVVAAYKRPKATDEEKAARTAAVQEAMRQATDVPLRVMRLSAAALDHARVIATHGHRAAASDAGVGIALLSAGLEGARLNVATNLGGLTDADYAAGVRREAEQLQRAAAASVDAATKLSR